MVEGHGWGELVLNWGRWEIFKVSLHSWQRGTPFFMKIPYITYPLFQILSTPLNHPPPPSSLPCHLQPLSPTALCVFLFLWLNGWSHHIWCAILRNDNNGSTHVEPCYLNTRRTLMCVLCSKAPSLLRPDT